jgi:hypothetical protein
MKKIILFGLMFCAWFSNAQILNPSFEAVTSNKPDDWNLTSYSSYFIRDTASPYAGNRAAYIKAFGAQSYSVQGAVLGVFSHTVPTRPVFLEGWYKCNLQPGDSLVFSPYAYQSTVFSTNAQAYAFTTTSTAVYKQFTAPFNYSAGFGNSVGTLFVSIYLSGPSTDAQGVFIPQAGTWAIIDELRLAYPVFPGIAENEANTGIEKIYPTPSSGYSHIIYKLTSEAACSLKLFDVTGKEVLSVFEKEQQSPGRYKAEVDLSRLSQGVYFAKLSVGEAVHVSKLVKE